ncbi:hypothetical protein BCR44DRAFT_90197, partial [Catenaria anguillulae PL171]
MVFTEANTRCNRPLTMSESVPAASTADAVARARQRIAALRLTTPAPAGQAQHASSSASPVMSASPSSSGGASGFRKMAENQQPTFTLTGADDSASKSQSQSQAIPRALAPKDTSNDALMQSQALFHLGTHANLNIDTSSSSLQSPSSASPIAKGLSSLSISVLRKRKPTTDTHTPAIQSSAAHLDARPHAPTTNHDGDDLEALLGSLHDQASPVISIPAQLDSNVSDALLWFGPTRQQLQQAYLVQSAKRAQGQAVPYTPPMLAHNQAYLSVRHPSIPPSESPYAWPWQVDHVHPIHNPASASDSLASAAADWTTSEDTRQAHVLRLHLLHVHLTCHPLLPAHAPLLATLDVLLATYARLTATDPCALLSAHLRSLISEYKRARRTLLGQLDPSQTRESPLWHMPSMGNAVREYVRGQDWNWICEVLAQVRYLKHVLVEIRECRRKRQDERRAVDKVQRRIEDVWMEIERVRTSGFRERRMVVDEIEEDGLFAQDEVEDEVKDLEREEAEWAKAIALERDLCAVILGNNPSTSTNDNDKEDEGEEEQRLPAYAPAETVYPRRGVRYRFEFDDDQDARSENEQLVETRTTTSWMAKVMVAGIVVASTQAVVLDVQTQRVRWNEPLDVVVPKEAGVECVDVTIYEHQGHLRTPTFIAHLSLPTPYSSHIHGTHSLTFSSPDAHISGSLTYQLTWLSAPPSIPLAPATLTHFPHLTTLVSPASLDAHAILKCIQQLHLHVPPEHALVADVNELASMARALVVPPGHVEVVSGDDANALGDFGAVDARRLQVLRQRANKEIVVGGPVPLDGEIMTLKVDDAQPPSKVLQLLQHSKSELGSTRFSTLARRLHIRHLHARGTLTQARQFDSLVREVRLPRQQDEGNILFDLFRARRKLRPEKQEPRWSLKGTGEAGSERRRRERGEYAVVVAVKRGVNFPTRAGGGVGAGRGKAGDADQGGGPPADVAAALPGLFDVDDAQSARERLYVQVSYDGKVTRTLGVVHGPHPEWNAAVSLSVKIPSEQALPNGVIHINVFDEVLVDMHVDDRTREKTVFYVKEAKWIGQVTVPMVDLCEQGRIVGRFPVTVGVPLMGYTMAAEEAVLDLAVSLTPDFSIDEQLQLQAVSSMEHPDTVQAAQRWLAKLPPASPSPRFALALATDLSGQQVLVSRYLSPLAPPAYITSVDQAVRFVAMIPTLSDRLSFAADVEIWATCDQFLALGAGDGIDHAILLACLLMYLAVGDVYLVLGYGVPDGRTAHVMYIPTGANSGASLANALDRDEEPIFVNPLTGRTYRARDRPGTSIGLHGIGCVVGVSNLWLNVQPVDATFATPPMVWDFNNTSAWRPLFSNTPTSATAARTLLSSLASLVVPTSSSNGSGPGTRRPEPWTSIQPTSLTYTRVPSKSIKALQTQLESTLTRNIESWRLRPTRWNRLLCRVLSRLAAASEVHGDPDCTSPDQRRALYASAMAEVQKMASIQDNHIYVVSINVPWTEEEAVVEAVKETRWWDTEDPAVELAMAVWCVGGISGVVGVWVWLASSVRRWNVGGAGTAAGASLRTGSVRAPSAAPTGTILVDMPTTPMVQPPLFAGAGASAAGMRRRSSSVMREGLDNLSMRAGDDAEDQSRPR